MTSVDLFYRDLAELYCVISNDRSFSRQCDFVLEYSESLGCHFPKRILELFAGPAYHGRRFAALGYDVVAVDSSRQMAQQASLEPCGNLVEYLVASIPEVLSAELANRRFDIILALRYSIGYLAPAGLARTIAFFSDALEPGGVAFIELHDVDVLRRGFAGSDLRDRRCTLPNKSQVQCTWPSAPPTWLSEDLVEMQLRITHLADGIANTYELVSREHIYDLGTLSTLGADSGLRAHVVEADSSVFNDGRLIVLAKEC
jgi:hypothetical protein